MREVGHTLTSKDEGIKLDRELQSRSWKESWKKIKRVLKKETERRLIDQYNQKELQSETYSKQEKECSKWLECSLDPRKTVAIVSLQEQMVETRSWKVSRGVSDGTECADYAIIVIIIIIHIDREINAIRPDIVTKDKRERRCKINDVAIPSDYNTSVKVAEKLS